MVIYDETLVTNYIYKNIFENTYEQSIYDVTLVTNYIYKNIFEKYM